MGIDLFICNFDFLEVFHLTVKMPVKPKVFLGALNRLGKFVVKGMRDFAGRDVLFAEMVALIEKQEAQHIPHALQFFLKVGLILGTLLAFCREEVHHLADHNGQSAAPDYCNEYFHAVLLFRRLLRFV